MLTIFWSIKGTLVEDWSPTYESFDCAYFYEVIVPSLTNAVFWDQAGWRKRRVYPQFMGSDWSQNLMGIISQLFEWAALASLKPLLHNERQLEEAVRVWMVPLPRLIDLMETRYDASTHEVFCDRVVGTDWSEYGYFSNTWYMPDCYSVHYCHLDYSPFPEK
jgi:hypothetical protein